MIWRRSRLLVLVAKVKTSSFRSFSQLISPPCRRRIFKGSAPAAPNRQHSCKAVFPRLDERIESNRSERTFVHCLRPAFVQLRLSFDDQRFETFVVPISNGQLKHRVIFFVSNIRIRAFFQQLFHFTEEIDVCRRTLLLLQQFDQRAIRLLNAKRKQIRIRRLSEGVFLHCRCR